jgi:hypothetical protein
MMEESSSAHNEYDLENALDRRNPILSNYQSNDDSPTIVKSQGITNLCFRKICMSNFIVATILPFAFCDLYFAITDNSCLKDRFDDLAINMRDYLLISSILELVATLSLINIIILYNFETCDIDEDPSDCFVINLEFIKFIILLFTLSWFVLGNVIFWGYLQTTGCDLGLYYYLFIRSIITILITIVNIVRKDKLYN